MIRRPPRSTLFPYTTLFRSAPRHVESLGELLGPGGAIAEVMATDGVRVIRNRGEGDRKSTRLNSSHSQISYAVFCLKKKKNVDVTQHAVRLTNRWIEEREVR